MKRTNLLIIFYFFCVVSAFSQASNEKYRNALNQSINTAGGSGSTEQGSIAYSIGQTFYTMMETSSAIVSNGVQQNQENDPEDFITPNLSDIFVYPNPTYSDVTLANVENAPGTFQIINTQGKIVKNGILDTVSGNIPMEDLTPQLYILKAFFDDKTSKTIKIIKR